MQIPNVLLLSGHYPVSHWQAQNNHKLFAERMGLDYRHNSHATNTVDPYMHKLNWFLEELPKYDFVFWVDDDSYFTGMLEEDLRKCMNNGSGFFLTGRPEEKGVETSPINTSFFGLKNTKSSFQLLERARSITADEISSLWKDEYGGSYGGDQDRLWLGIQELELAGKNSQPYSGVALIGDLSLNGRFQDVTLDSKFANVPKIIHLTGRTGKKWKKLTKLEKSPVFTYGLLRVEDEPSLHITKRGHHRVLASRVADHQSLQPLARLLPGKVLRWLGIRK